MSTNGTKRTYTRKKKVELGTPIPDQIKVHNDKLGYKEWILSEDQKKLDELITNHDIVFVAGRAGSGKTGGVLYNFINEYVMDKNKKIIIIRTPVEAGSDKIGFLPDNLDKKIEPHFQPVRDILDNLLNKEKVACDLGKRIVFKIPNYVLGATLDDSLICISEAQQIQPMIMKLLLERIGNGSKCVVEGAEDQIYTTDKSRNGLTDAINTFFNRDEKGDVVGLKNKDWEGKIAYFKFSTETNMRSEIVKIVNTAYELRGL